MTMQVSANFNNISKIDQKPTNALSYKSPNNNKKEAEFKSVLNKKEVPGGVKLGAFVMTLLGVGAAMAVTIKKQKMPLNNLKDFFNGLVKIKYCSKEHEVEKLVGRVAIGSVGGGLLGGAIFDKKENMNAKYREAIIQMVGNIATPLACVSLGIHLFEDKAEAKIVEMMKLTGKSAKVPKIVASAGLLVAAIFLGNKVGNALNEKLFSVNDNRKLKLADMSPHIDDACLALSLVASESSCVVSRIIPAALMIAGVSTGIAQERPERVHSKVVEKPVT